MVTKQNISLALLESKWVTDDIFQVVFDILNNIVHQDIFLVNPVLTLAIKTMIDFGEFVQPQNLENKKFIFFPINNSSSAQDLGGSGTHWSLCGIRVKTSSIILTHWATLIFIMPR